MTNTASTKSASLLTSDDRLVRRGIDGSLVGVLRVLGTSRAAASLPDRICVFLEGDRPDGTTYQTRSHFDLGELVEIATESTPFSLVPAGFEPVAVAEIERGDRIDFRGSRLRVLEAEEFAEDDDVVVRLRLEDVHGDVDEMILGSARRVLRMAL